MCPNFVGVSHGLSFAKFQKFIWLHLTGGMPRANFCKESFKKLHNRCIEHTERDLNKTSKT